MNNDNNVYCFLGLVHSACLICAVVVRYFLDGSTRNIIVKLLECHSQTSFWNRRKSYNKEINFFFKFNKEIDKMSMEIDDEEIEITTSTSSKGEKKRFEVKKVTYWLLKFVWPCFSSFPLFFYFLVERCGSLGMGWVLNS